MNKGVPLDNLFVYFVDNSLFKMIAVDHLGTQREKKMFLCVLVCWVLFHYRLEGRLGRGDFDVMRKEY